ncbi:MAG: phosphate ABC transporter substrate-binding/OmpA family protein, partial [Mesorhizobium sp.]|nr:phosphate ABC transporter substrate-binding/OmpA family protein [Mesorhizobium sp.]
LPGGENFEVELASKGSGTAFESLASARAVIGMSSRAIKPSEADLLRQQLGVDMLDAASEHVLALDGLAVIVNSTNPLRDVAFNLETIAQIFSGQIANWSQLGGTAAPINVYARDSKSGTFSTFDDMVMKPASLSLAGAAKRFESSDELTDSVENDPNGIGFIGLPYVRNNRALQIGSTCGIAYGPSRFTIQTEVYPLSRRLYLYTPGTPRQGLASDLLNFSMSPEAQPIIRDAGFIDQTVELEDVQQRATWVASLSETADARAPRDMQTQLLDIAGKVTRASVNFRFRSGSSELDNKALSDVRRIARALQNPSFGGQNWFLVGFADSDGSFRTNLNLAFARSQAVAKVLAAQGVQVPNNRIASFSWLAPVACNSDEQGKALNRRVELWFTP